MDYLKFISDQLGVEIGMISTGPERDATIVPPERSSPPGSELREHAVRSPDARAKVIEVAAVRAPARRLLSHAKRSSLRAPAGACWPSRSSPIATILL